MNDDHVGAIGNAREGVGHRILAPLAALDDLDAGLAPPRSRREER